MTRRDSRHLGSLIVIGIALLVLIAVGAAALMVGSPWSAGPPTPSATPGASVSATASPASSASPSVSTTPTLRPSASALMASVVGLEGANIRRGPGMDQPIVGLSATGTILGFDGWFLRSSDPPQPDAVSGRIEAWSRDWLHLADGRGWIHDSMLDIRPPSWLPLLAWTPPPAPTPAISTGRAIIVSLSRQHLWAYADGRMVLDTVVATGMPALPTPPGTYHIFRRVSPIEFISPWPSGSPYWYPTVWSSYALEFIDGGYYIHDAPRRTLWGPGTNLTPQGTHGCVNVPVEPMSRLYAWAQLGDTVVVEP